MIVGPSCLVLQILPSILSEYTDDAKFIEMQHLWGLCSHGAHSFGFPHNDPRMYSSAATIRQICREIVLVGYMTSNLGNPRFRTASFMDCAWSTGWGNGIGASEGVLTAAAVASNGFESAAPSRFKREYSDLPDANPLFSWLFDSVNAGASAISACTISKLLRQMCTTPFTLALPGGHTVVLSSIFDVFCGNFEGLCTEHRALARHCLKDLRRSLLPASMVVWYHLATTLGGLQAKVDCDYTNADGPATVMIWSSNRDQFLRLVARFLPGAYALRSTVAGCVIHNSTLPTLPDEIWDIIFDCCMQPPDATGAAPYRTPEHYRIVRFCMKDNIHRALELDFPICMCADLRMCLDEDVLGCMKVDRFVSLSADLRRCCKDASHMAHQWLRNAHTTASRHIRKRLGCKVPTLNEISRAEGILPEVESRCRRILEAHPGNHRHAGPGSLALVNWLDL